MLKRVLNEPLIQFLFLGVLLVAADNFLLDSSTPVDIITVSATEQQRIVDNWRQRWARLPTEAERAKLTEEYVREEVLYREAVRLGLDTHDTIVRRRLAQKMQFLLETGDPSYRPDDAMLRAYVRDNPARFRTPASVSFRHLFFSNDRRRHVLEDANVALTMLGSTSEEPSETVGDRFPFGKRFEAASQIDLIRAFGPGFAEQVLQSPEGKWSGPIESAFGQHLVFVTQRMPRRLPSLDRIRQAVQSAYLSEHAEHLAEERYEAIRERFVVVVDPVADDGLRASAGD